MRHAEDDLADVGLGEVGQEPQQAGGPPEADQQDTGGARVERAGMADPALAVDPPAAGDDVVRRPPGRLVDDHQAVDDRGPRIVPAWALRGALRPRGSASAARSRSRRPRRDGPHDGTLPGARRRHARIGRPRRRPAVNPAAKA